MDSHAGTIDGTVPSEAKVLKNCNGDVDASPYVWCTVNFTVPFSSVPGVVAKIQTYNGPDPAHLRGTNLTSTSVSFTIEEDQTLDAERTHVAEDIGWWAIGQQGIYLLYKAVNPSVSYLQEQSQTCY